MFDAEGGPPDMGHVFLALDPGPLSGGSFAARMSDLLEVMAAEADVRLPGSRRLEGRARASREGLSVPAALVDEIRQIAAGGA